MKKITRPFHSRNFLNFYTILYFLLLFTFNVQNTLLAQTMDPLSMIFAKGTLNESIDSPSKTLGFEAGERHMTPLEAKLFYSKLAEQSDRVIIVPYGKTHEKRDLYLVIISTPENLSQLEKIRKREIKKLITWFGYSIHGNESSAANAAPYFAYHLAASTKDEVKTQLSETVVIIDPIINPDGLNRFATWANARQSKVLHTHSQDIEHAENWPSGRTNHYWFDLNRDWLPLVHPESKGRMAMYHHWRPHILTDHHEMGTDGTFFFQPGVPSRNNPLTPKQNYIITNELGNYHAKYLDAIGTLYYSGERFDDFYVGKGSTYPDVTGGVGILFEQASSRGLLQAGKNGLVSLKDGMINQLTVSLSTLDGAYHAKEEIKAYQENFSNNAMAWFTKNKIGGYSFSGKNDLDALEAFLEFLSRHQIEVDYKPAFYKNENTTKLLDLKNSKFFIPANQKQAKFIQSIFEPQVSFKDSIFYDVSAWPMQYAFNVKMNKLSSERFSKSQAGKQTFDFKNYKKEKAKNVFNDQQKKSTTIGYVLPWGDLKVAETLYQLQSKNINVRIAQRPFTIQGQNFKEGDVVIPLHIKTQKSLSLIHKVLNETGIDTKQVFKIESGRASSGVDLGSDNFVIPKFPKVAVLVEEGVSPYDAGEIWHMFDTRLKIPFVLLPIRRLNRFDLASINTLVLPHGNYKALSNHATKIKLWVQKGGKIIGIKGGSEWVSKQVLGGKIYHQVKSKTDTLAQYPYYLANRNRGALLIRGAAFNTKLDLTNPICFGFRSDELGIFRNHKKIMKMHPNGYSNPVRYNEQPLISGYMPKRKTPVIKNSAAVLTQRFGRGKVVCFVDNPLFRGYWWGSQKLFVNAVLMY